MSEPIRADRPRPPFVAVLATIVLFLSTVAAPPLMAGSQEKPKDKPSTFARVYQYPYDEVFASVPRAIERVGWVVIETKSESGEIAGRPADPVCSIHFTFHVKPVEAAGSQPATKVIIEVTSHGFACYVHREGVSVHLFNSLLVTLSARP